MAMMATSVAGILLGSTQIERERRENRGEVWEGRRMGYELCAYSSDTLHAYEAIYVTVCVCKIMYACVCMCVRACALFDVVSC